MQVAETDGGLQNRHLARQVGSFSLVHEITM